MNPPSQRTKEDIRGATRGLKTGLFCQKPGHPLNHYPLLSVSLLRCYVWQPVQKTVHTFWVSLAEYRLRVGDQQSYIAAHMNEEALTGLY